MSDDSRARVRVRVLVVDDSAFARKVMREILQTSARIEVVGIARDGLDALEKIAALSPDVVTLDLVMPGLDGLGVLRALPSEGAPRVVVVSSSDRESELGLAALEAGAVDIVHKPTTLATDRLYEISTELVDRVLVAAASRAPTPLPEGTTAAAAKPAPMPTGYRARASSRIVVVGASTGGPQALTRLINAFPLDFPAPIAIVLHIPIGYTAAFAERLNQSSALDVVEASEGTELRPGRVVVARAGIHLRVERTAAGGTARLGIEPAVSPHRPSVDVLFESAAAGWGRDVLAVVLTGMGDDGLAGSRAVHAAGGIILTEAESSCVVYGMPERVFTAGLSAAAVPIESMALEIMRRI